MKMATDRKYQIDISQLKALLARVEKFPIDAGSLLDLANKSKVPKPIVEFFQAIDPLTSLGSKQDIITRAEEINILHTQHADTDKNIPHIEEHEID